jgi:hypothetical protein
MDGSRFVRSADIVAVTVEPTGVTPDDDHGVGFGLSVSHE